MIAESVEHAFEDMSERVFTEAKLKSEEMLPAVRAALAQLGNELPLNEQEKIAGLIQEVEQAIEKGEVQRLKKANAALDQGTESLAAMLVERALEDALRRKGAI
jgi:molecular chaperone DnaK